MTLNILPGVPLAGTLAITFVPADLQGFDYEAPTTEAVTDPSAVVVQCLIPTGTYTGDTSETNQIRKGRACTTVPYYVQGEKSVNLGSIQVVYDPQDLSADISAAYAALTVGSQWYKVERRGVDGQTALGSGDIVDIKKVEVIARNKPYSDEEGSEAVAEIILRFLGEEAEDVEIDGEGSA